MDDGTPTKRKRPTAEMMEIDSPRSSPRRTKSLDSPRASPRKAKSIGSPLLRPPSPSPSILLTPSSPSSIHFTPSSPVKRLHSPNHRSNTLRPHSPIPLVPSPLRNAYSPHASPVSSPLVSGDEYDGTSPNAKRRKSSGTSGSESKANVVAKVKKIVNTRLQPLKPLLMTWLQKFLSDRRLGDYIDKLQFRIDPTAFGTKFPVTVHAAPIIPEESFVKQAQDLSGPILVDYPGIFHEADVPDELRERAISLGVHLQEMVAEQVAEFFGRCWDCLGGFVKFHGGANISINGTHKHFDLVSRYWIKEAH